MDTIKQRSLIALVRFVKSLNSDVEGEFNNQEEEIPSIPFKDNWYESVRAFADAPKDDDEIDQLSRYVYGSGLFRTNVYELLDVCKELGDGTTEVVRNDDITSYMDDFEILYKDFENIMREEKGKAKDRDTIEKKVIEEAGSSLRQQLDAAVLSNGGETYDELKRFVKPDRLYAYAAKQMVDNPEAKGMLRSIFRMDPKDYTLLLTVLKVSFLEYNTDSLPRNADGKIEDATFEKAEESYKQSPPSDGLLAAISRPSAESTPYKALSSMNDSLHNPLVNIVMAPDGLSGGTIVTNDSIIVRVSSKTVFTRLVAEIDAYKQINRNLDSIGVDAKRRLAFNQRCLFVDRDMSLLPDPVWSRATVKFKADARSTAHNKLMEGVMLYTLRSDAGQYEEGEQKDLILAKKMATIPMCAYGSSQIGLFMTMRKFEASSAVIDDYTVKVKKSYAADDPSFYGNYYNFIRMAKGLAPDPFKVKNKVVALGDYLLDNGTHVQSVLLRRYQKEKFLPVICKYMSVNFAIRRALAEELSYCGVVQLHPLAYIRERIADDKMDTFVVAGYTIASQLGFDVTYHDNTDGQGVDRGEFKALKERGGARVIQLNHHYKVVDADRIVGVYDRDKFEVPKVSVLIDLVIPGSLYSPQNDEAFKNKAEFTGTKMLIGSFNVDCLYDIDVLMKHEAFLVYTSAGFYYPGVDVNDETGRVTTATDISQQTTKLNKLFSRYDCTVFPTSIIDWAGVYLVGVKKAKLGKSNFQAIRTFAVASITSKVRAIAHGFENYPSNPRLEYDRGVDALATCVKTMAALRILNGKKIGTPAAYADYIKMTEGKTRRAVDLINESRVDDYFSVVNEDDMQAWDLSDQYLDQSKPLSAEELEKIFK